MAFKTKNIERVIVVRDVMFKDIHVLGLEEACTQYLPFLSSFGQLSYKQCNFLLDNFPYQGTSRTDTDQLVFLFALTDAVVTNFAHPSEGMSMFTNKSNSFTKIMYNINFAWKIVFMEITRKSKVVGHSIGINTISCLENLLKVCIKSLQSCTYPDILDESINAAVTAKLNLQDLQKKNTLSNGCLSSHSSQQNEPVTLKLKVKSPSKLLSPSKLKSPLTVSQGENSLKSTHTDNNDETAERFVFSNKKFSSLKHDCSCYCDMCFTPPQEKMQPENKILQSKSISPKKVINNENSAKSNTSPQTTLQLPKPPVKRPLFGQQQQQEMGNKKHCWEEKSLLDNGKVNAFSFMMLKAKGKKA